jgi:uncharacterized phosphosugar-binding protein
VAVSGRWIEAALGILGRLTDEQGPVLDEVADRCADAIAAGGLVHLFGCGHSRIPLEEAFPRYASYPGFHPMAELSMTFHTQVVGSNGQRQAMFIERVSGLAEVILGNYAFGPHDLLVVFSVGGRSAVPIEMAMGARARGVTVVAVTSLAETMAAPPEHASGTRLCDHADLVIDTCTPIGDGLVTLDGLETPVAPGSTLAYVAIVNELKARTAELLLARDALPPVLASSALLGPEETEAQFRRAYEDHARRYASVLAVGDDGAAPAPAARGG